MSSDYVGKGFATCGASLLHDVSLPAAVVLDAPLMHNIQWMQRFAEDHGARLAPHGKTTMTPALFRRQLAAGAWGITLATATQCAAASSSGVTRIFMANQLVGTPNMAIIAKLIDDGVDFYCLVDNPDNVRALNSYFSGRGIKLQVLVELGVPNGRCGVRTDAELDAMTTAIAAAPALVFAGIEGYEGVIGGEKAEKSVRSYGERLVETFWKLEQKQAFDIPAPIITAAGSDWFDLIAIAFEQQPRGRYTPLLRPGCYVVHDHRMYRETMAEIRARHPELKDGLEPALEVYAHVQSLPEPGLAIAALGKRDIAYDSDLPMPLRLYRRHGNEETCEVADWHTFKIMDQHTMMRIPHDADVEVGDILAFGTLHPCLTFDKWRQVLRVDPSLEVLEVMPTLF